MKTITTLLAVLILSGCSILESIKPETLTNAVVGHASFPSLSMQVSECLADYPEARAQAIEPWDRLVDKWQAADDLEANAELVKVLASAQSQVREAKQDWLTIKALVIESGADCGPAVERQVQIIESAFTDIEAAIKSNEQIVYALQWADLIASIVAGRSTGVVRL